MRVLEELKSLALNLSWSWDGRIEGAFEALDRSLWEESGHNPWRLLSVLGAAGVERALKRPETAAAVAAAIEAAREERAHIPRPPAASAPLQIAYFSLEFGLAEALPIYSGGLGILAGDHLKGASDLGLPLVGVGLLYREGFGRQRINRMDEQYEVYPAHPFGDLPIERVMTPAGPLQVECRLRKRCLLIAVWRVQVGRTPLFLLDTDLDANDHDLRGVTDRLYGPDAGHRLRQEMVLGIGGMRALQAMDIHPTVFHMNEGHGFLVAIERIRELRAGHRLTLEESRLLARAGLVFTTHTPVAAGSDYFGADLIRADLGPYLREVGIKLEEFMDLGRPHPRMTTEPLCTTYVGLRMADHSVAVSRLHGAVSRRIWKDAWPGLPEDEIPIASVTNGVHLPTWVSAPLSALLKRFVDPHWWDLDVDDRLWEGVAAIPDAELWECHCRLRADLVDMANERWPHARLNRDALTIGFSRRFAPYKRADLLLTNPQRLAEILGQPDRPVQFIFAGKAHPADDQGKLILQKIVRLARSDRRIAFVEDYSIEVAKPLVQGADVWLNNPRRLLEASGTSGMKAGVNGGLNLSVLDGWWDEAYTPTAGWAIPSRATLEHPASDDVAEAEALYGLLEREVVPLFYTRDEHGRPAAWLQMMRSSIMRVATAFSARRMLLDYHQRCYSPAAQRVEQLRRLRNPG